MMDAQKGEMTKTQFVDDPIRPDSPGGPPPEAMGFVPGTCSFCHAQRLIRAGACAVCTNCGTTTGCS